MTPGLSAEDIERFRANGYLGPIRILEAAACAATVKHFDSDALPAPAGWWKGHAAADRHVFDVATREEILAPVTALLGPDVVLWGAQLVRRAPGQEHTWHADIETLEAPANFVSVWLGLENTSRQSGLKFVTGSHLAPKSIQQVGVERGLARPGMGDDDVLALAEELCDHASIAHPDVADGQAVFFAGAIWHASLNVTNRTRSALLLQYVTADVPVLILDHTRLDWPFGFTAVRAPSVLVAGSAETSPHDLRDPPARSKDLAE